jgi:hypothetical protein
MATDTVLDLITLALKKARVLGKGDILDDDDAQDALDTVNMMLDSWSLDRLFVYVDELQTFQTTGNATYTIGPGGDFDTARPNKLVSAYALVNSVSYPIEILDNGQQYDHIALKTLGGVWPSFVWYEKTAPLGTLHFWPTGAATINLRFTKALQQFSSLTDQIELPAGYKKVLVDAAAVELSQVNNTDIPATVIQSAANAIARLKRANSQPVTRALEVSMVSSRYGRGYGAGVGDEGGNLFTGQTGDFIEQQ